MPAINFNGIREKLISALNDASGYLEVAEYFVDAPEKLSKYRSGINEVA